MSTQTTRPYRKRRRAELEAATRRRITDATMELHALVGPARTTVSAIAERAGVQRATVYRHFPDDASLIAACSAHWAALNPAPDLAAWAAIEDVDDRLRVAIGEIYDWYERTEAMVELLNRDRASVPALDERMRLRDAYFAAALEALLRGRPERGANRRRARAAIAHALEFETWRSLVRHQGLDREDAIELMLRLVAR
jgi:AcrR family transcriptional regulator